MRYPPLTERKFDNLKLALAQQKLRVNYWTKTEVAAKHKVSRNTLFRVEKAKDYRSYRLSSLTKGLEK